jgi:hypothetical protein
MNTFVYCSLVGVFSLAITLLFLGSLGNYFQVAPLWRNIALGVNFAPVLVVSRLRHSASWKLNLKIAAASSVLSAIVIGYLVICLPVIFDWFMNAWLGSKK